MRAEAAVFDLAGVLFAFDHTAGARIFGKGLPLSLPELSRQWDHWLLAEESLAKGRADLLDRFWSYMGQEFVVPSEMIDEFRRVPILSVVRPSPDARPALQEAKRRGLKVGVLSNSPPVDTNKLLDHAGVADLVDAVCTPQESGTAKPALGAYLTIARLLHVQPQGCIFFDDEPANVTGAASAGMRSYLVDRGQSETSLENRVVRDLSAIHEILG